MKEEKQHIENQLARNDHKIQIYCEEYEQLVRILFIVEELELIWKKLPNTGLNDHFVIALEGTNGKYDRSKSYFRKH